MSQIAEFIFEQRPVRIEDRDGNLWFVVNDVCEILQLTNPRKAMASIPEKSKGVTKGYTPGGMQEMAIVDESGLYRLIFKSRTDQAEEFQAWVTEVVLPSIRKTGSYSAAPALPQTFAEALRLAADQAEQLERRSQQLIEQAPKVEFAEALQASEDEFDLSTVAKMVGWGTIKLYAKLREVPVSQPFLLRYSGNLNLPSDTYVKLGYARVIATPYDQKHRDGRLTKHVSRKTVITMRGVEAIRRWIA